MGLDGRKPISQSFPAAVSSYGSASVRSSTLLEEGNATGLFWFALVVRNRWEKCTAFSLSRKGYECLLPISKQKRRWSDRWKELEVALFPGYLFCRFDPCRRVPVLSVPGVLSIVGTTAGLSPVRPDEIEAVKLVGQAGVPAEPWPFLEAGQMVELNQGPLRGLSGVVLDCKAGSKLVISVTLLKRSIAVEIDRAWVSRSSAGIRIASRPPLDVSILDLGSEPRESQPLYDPPVISSGLSE